MSFKDLKVGNIITSKNDSRFKKSMYLQTQHRIPEIVKPTYKALKYFGLMDAKYIYDISREMYYVAENSGIIRAGFTLEFFIDFQEFFIWDKKN